VYFGQRYYDCATGRWLSRDPLGETASLNLYSYVGNEPLDKIDPIGNDFIRVEGNQVFFVVEDEGFTFNTDVQSIPIGSLNNGVVNLRSSLGGGRIELSDARGIADNIDNFAAVDRLENVSSAKRIALLKVAFSTVSVAQQAGRGRTTAVISAAAEGAGGGVSISVNTFTFGGSDFVGFTDSTQFQGGEFTATRILATVSRETALTAATLGSSQLARAGFEGARRTTIALNSFDAGRSAFDVVQGAREGDLLRAGLGGLGLSGGLRALGEVADARRLAQEGGESVTRGARAANEAGVVREFVAETDQIFFRVFSHNPTGGFLTKVRPRSSAFAREALSLPPENAARFIQEVRVPAGTLLRRSRAAPLFGRRGGAEQFQLLKRLPDENFGPGVPFE